MSQVLEAADVSGIRVSDPAPGRGMTTCNLSDAHGRPLTFQLGSAEAPLRSPFGAGVYGGAEENAKATRLNLDALVTGRDDVIAKFREIDAQIVAWLRERTRTSFLACATPMRITALSSLKTPSTARRVSISR